MATFVRQSTDSARAAAIRPGILRKHPPDVVSIELKIHWLRSSKRTPLQAGCLTIGACEAFLKHPQMIFAGGQKGGCAGWDELLLAVHPGV